MSAPSLGPRTGGVFVNAHVARVLSTVIVIICTDRDSVTSRVHRYRPAREILPPFAINVSAELGPSRAVVGVDAHVTTAIISVAIVLMSTDRNPVTGCVQRDMPARVVPNCFPIDVCAELGPGTGGVLVNAHVTRVGTVIKGTLSRPGHRQSSWKQMCQIGHLSLPH